MATLHGDVRDADRVERRVEVRSAFTETKGSLLTTEFWAMVGVIAGILIASAVVDDGEGAGAAGDAFSAQRAWLYVAIVAVGYMVSRGLAKAGSREPYWAGPDDLPGRDSDDRG